MGRSPNTVSAELIRNETHGVYNPQKASHKAYVRRKYARYQGQKIVEHRDLCDEIVRRLKDGQSVEMIAKRITKHETHLPSVSKDAIYRYLKSPYGGSLAQHLRKQKRRSRRERRKKLEGRTFIDRRPKHINARRRIGDVEADFIVSGKSGKGALLVVVARRHRNTFLERIMPATIANLEQAFLRIQARFPEMTTITTDNDILFQRHERLALMLHVQIFFCHPYHSWEKGTVENTNKVIRKDIPKGNDIAKHSLRFISGVEARLNRRPMDCLDSRTPDEMLTRYRARNKKHRRGGVS